MHKSQSLCNLIIALHVSGVTITHLQGRKTALHVSGVTITHLQGRKTTASTTSGNRCTVLLSAVIVEGLELISVPAFPR